MSVALVQQAAPSLGAALTASGVSIVVIQFLRRRPLVQSDLAQRWMTWAILGPLWLVAAAWTPGRTILLGAFAAVAAHEYGRLRTDLVALDRLLLTTLATLSVPVFVLADVDPLTLVVAMGLAGMILPLVSQDVSGGPRRIGGLMTGALLVVLPFVLLHALGDRSGAMFFTVGLAVAFSDVAAFVVGSSAGRRHFVRALSPNKTLAGVGGNLAGAALGVAVCVGSGIVGGASWWIAPVVAVGAITGDLFVSLLKRNRGVKDAGSWLPGFGGLLDRVDSLLVVALLVHVVVAIVGASA